MKRGILIITILAAGCISQVYTAEEAEQVAVEFIKKAPTFQFDGIPRSLKAMYVEPLDCEGCFEVTVEFNCLGVGFGNRGGLLVNQQLTQHVAKVRVEKGEVTQAIIDEIWDEIAQKAITE